MLGRSWRFGVCGGASAIYFVCGVECASKGRRGRAEARPYIFLVAIEQGKNAIRILAGGGGGGRRLLRRRGDLRLLGGRGRRCGSGLGFCGLRLLGCVVGRILAAWRMRRLLLPRCPLLLLPGILRT